MPRLTRLWLTCRRPIRPNPRITRLCRTLSPPRAPLDTGDGQSWSSLASRLAALSGQVNDRIRDALHLRVKQAFAVVSSHYDGLNFDAISKGYILSDDEDEAKREIVEFAKAVEVPGEALARLFEEDVGLPPAASSPAPEDPPAGEP